LKQLNQFTLVTQLAIGENFYRHSVIAVVPQALVNVQHRRVNRMLGIEGMTDVQRFYCVLSATTQ
jgi:hypothetical protein